MKYNAIKIISITMMLILLLGAFSSCGNRISVSKKEKIEKAFQDQLNWKEKVTIGEAGELVGWQELNYYGEFGGAHVFYMRDGGELMMPMNENKRISDEKISDGYVFTIWIYKYGKLYKIEEAYEKRIISKSVVANIARYHYKFRMVNEALEREDRRFYGSYTRCDVGFNEDGASSEGEYTLVVAGYEFKHNKDFSILGYADGDTRSLEWLYENGYLTENDIKKIYEIHSSFYEG